MDETGAVREILQNGDGFVIAGHTNPDGDAIGACLAMGLALTGLGRKANVVLEEYNKKFNVIPGQNLVYKGDVNALEPDVLVCLDCAGADRLGAARGLLDKARVTVCVDHHISNDFAADHTVLDPAASSTSEIVYRIIEPIARIDADIASALYAGVVFDTGGFRHGCASAETLRVAAKLMEKGIPFTEIYNELLHRNSAVEAAAFGEALKNISYYAGGRVCRSFIAAGFLRDLGAGGQDLDNIAEYMLNIRGVMVSAFMYEKPDGSVKVSFRSKKEDVSVIAKGYGGGGHAHAAGATLNGSLDEVRDRVTEKLTALYE